MTFKQQVLSAIQTDEEESRQQTDEERKVSTAGGERQSIGVRFDLIPGGDLSLRWVAAVASYGAAKYAPRNWQKLDPETEQSPLNHAIGHALEAAEQAPGSPIRKWNLAKVAWNALAQIWFEEKFLSPDGTPKER